MMINTGLLLRQPNESSYSAYRRFLIANPGASLAQLRSVLFNKLDVTPQSSVRTEHLAQTWEQRFCASEGLSFIAPPPPPRVNLPLRNCPDCARSGFHSQFTYYSWFRRCPVHHQAITMQCPQCREAWPRPSQLKSRHCPCCGASIPWRQLSFLKLTNALCGCRALTELNQVFLMERRARATLTSDLPSDRYYFHRSLRPMNARWFSQFFSDAPQRVRIAHAIDADLVPCVERTFYLESMPQADVLKVRARHTYETGWITRQVTKQVALELRALVRACSCEDITLKRLSRFELDLLPRLTGRTLLTQSLATWYALVEPGAINPPIPNARFFRTPGADWFPSVPKVLHRLLGQDDPESGVEACPAGQDVSVGLEVITKAWLFRLDLWWTYLAIVSYLDAFRRGLESKSTWGSFFDGLSDESDPLSWATPRLTITLLDGHRVRISLPRRYALICPQSLQETLSRNSVVR